MEKHPAYPAPLTSPRPRAVTVRSCGGGQPSAVHGSERATSEGEAGEKEAERREEEAGGRDWGLQAEEEAESEAAGRVDTSSCRSGCVLPRHMSYRDRAREARAMSIMEGHVLCSPAAT